jgi:hypothetical protein
VVLAREQLVEILDAQRGKWQRGHRCAPHHRREQRAQGRAVGDGFRAVRREHCDWVGDRGAREHFEQEQGARIGPMHVLEPQTERAHAGELEQLLRQGMGDHQAPLGAA